MLFPKLNLKHSYVIVPARAMNDYAWGYGKADKPIRVNPGMFDAEAYGVKSSAADMIRFVEANIRPEQFDDTVRRAIEGTHVGYFDTKKMVQGLGWEQYPYPVSLERLLDGNSRAMALEANPVTALIPRSVRGRDALQQDRIHQRLWRIRRLRAAKEDRRRVACQPQLPESRADQGGACDPETLAAASE